MITTDSPPTRSAIRSASSRRLRFCASSCVRCCLEPLAVVLAGPERLLLRQQKVAGKTGLHLHHIAHLPELFDALEQDHFNGGHRSRSLAPAM